MAILINKKSDNIIIDKMVEDDVESVLKIQSETGLSYWKYEDYTNEINRVDSICVVAKTQNERVVGFAISRKTLATDITENTFTSSEIYNIALSKSHQSKGIGQRIFDKIMSELRTQGIQEIWLEVRESNNQALRFYQKNGFIKQFERENYYQNPQENAFILKLNLLGKFLNQ